MIVDLSKFEAIFDAIRENSMKQTHFLSDINEQLDNNARLQMFGFAMLESSMNGVADSINRLIEIQTSMFDLEKEKISDEARKQETEKVAPKDDSENIPPTPEDVQDINQGFFSKLFEGLSDLSFGRILAAAALAPFIFQFAKGFILSLTDDVIEITAAGVTGISVAIQSSFVPILGAIRNGFSNIATFLNTTFSRITQSFGNLSGITKEIVNSIKNINSAFMAGVEGTRAIVRNVDGTFRSLNAFDDIMRSIGKNLSSVVTTASKIGSYIKTFGNTIKTAGEFVAKVFNAIPGSGALKLLLGRLALPITVLLGAVEAVKSFMDSEGTLIERFGAGVGGFMASVIGAPLDLLKNVVSWVLEKFGFDETSEAISSFSFSDTIRSLVGGIFGIVSDAVQWVQNLFVDPTEALSTLWSNAIGGSAALLDIIFYPINKAIEWVSSIFQWNEGESFSLADMIWNSVGSAISWVKGIFSDPLPALTSLLSNALGGYKSLLDIIFYPVDKAIQWISSAFGWEEVESFSLTDVIWDSINSAMNWAKGIFSDPSSMLSSLLSSVLGENGSLSDLMFYPVDKAFQWIKGIFSWEEGEDYSLSDVIDNTINEIKEFFAGLFDFLPSLEEVKASLTSMLPQWMQPESIESQRDRLSQEISMQKQLIASGDTRDWTLKKRETIVQELESQLSALPQYNKGTSGFVDFGEGSPAMLHGEEAVVPKGTPAGAFLEQFFTSNWQPKIDSMIESVSPITPSIEPILIHSIKQNYVAVAAENTAMNRERAQAAITNIMPNVVNSRPVTNNNSSTTIINNVSPARSLDDPSMLK